ncbi:MAG: type II secretion system protein GspE, partial [Planctomycetes bacterium]|nr:type II secretion system protein GspE [Planctomycetota bacterium]
MKTTGKIIRLGDQLIEEGMITEAQLKLALKAQKRDHEPLGRILVNLGFITERMLAEKLAEQMEIPFVSLKTEVIDKELIRTIPPELARKHQFIPIRREEDNSITVAMANP